MNPPILPAYSLRVQLFLSTACDSEDKPVRNFRVVTSPEISVREFCQEASRIHEINYGQPLVIKRVQDDQAFDVTQSEILGNLFGTSSIVRVVQASKHSGIRDSIPASSALRFDPSAIRKRERCYDELVPDLENSWRPSKRQKFYVTDPDSPLPSRESDAASPSNLDHPLHSQITSTLGKFGNTEKYYPKKLKYQISETPEPVSKIWQNLKTHQTRSVGTQKCSKSDYHEQRNLFKHNVKNDYGHLEPGTTEYESTNQHPRMVYERESSASSKQSSIYLGQSPAIKFSTQSSKLGKNLTPMMAHNDLLSNSIHNRVAKNKSLKYDTEKLKNQRINNLNPSSNNSEKAQAKPIILPRLDDGQLVTGVNRDAKVLNAAQHNHSLQEVHSEKITSKNLNYKTHIEKLEQQNTCVENSIKGTDTLKEIQDIQNKQSKQKKKKRKKKKEVTQKLEPQTSSFGGAQGRQEKQPSQKLEEKSQNIDSRMANGEQIPPKETKSIENQLLTKNVLNDKKGHLKPTAVTEKSKDDSNSHSSPSKSNSKNIFSSSVIPPPRERKRSSAIESLPAQISLHSKSSNQEKMPINDNSNHTVHLSHISLPNTEEKRKDVATRISNKILPNTPASLQTKSSTPNTSNVKDTKCIIPLQKKSFTPILPPQKALDISNILIARDDSKTRTTRSKTASAAKIIPAKITPAVSNKKSQPIKPNNKPKLPNGSSNKEPITITSCSKHQDLICTNHGEKNESFNEQDSVDEAMANSIIETSSNKENIQEVLLNSQPKNLNELKDARDASRTGDDINREETLSQNSSDRDSRSPIEFHQSFQPEISHRTSSLSSNSHSDIEDSRLNGDNTLSVPDDSDDSSDIEDGHELDTQERNSENSHFQLKPITSSNTQLNLEYQEAEPNSPYSTLKVQVPNSSPALKRNLSLNYLTNTNVPDLSHSKAQGNLSKSFISGSAVVPSSLEVKKPQFKFGASLSEIHRSGGLLSMSQTNNRSNEQNILAMSLATETQSEGESEDSDTSLSS